MNRFLKIFRESLSEAEHDFTQGSIRYALVLLSIPMVLEMVMESLFALVDAYFVAGIGPDAIATVGLTESIITIVYSVAIGISMAPVAMISRFIGEKKPEQAAHAARQSVYLALIVSLFLSVPGIVYAPDILRMMGGSEELVASGQGYTRIAFGGNVVVMLLFLLNGIFRGAGAATYAMRTLWLANGINIILDPIFIYGWGPIPAMGVSGAAIATLIGRGVGVAYQLYILLGGHSQVDLRHGSWRLDGSMLRRLGNIASTGAFQYIIASASWIFLMRINANFGSEAVAGYTIAIRMIIFTLLPAWGLSNATATLVGQNLGAQLPDRAASSVHLAAWYNALFLGFVSIFYLVFARQFMLIFDDDPEVLAAGVTALRIFAIGYAFYGVGMIYTQAFNGAGDTRTPTVINIICFWMLEIPLGYLLGLHLNLGVAGVTWAVVIAESILTVIAIWLFRKGKWKETVV